SRYAPMSGPPAHPDGNLSVDYLRAGLAGAGSASFAIHVEAQAAADPAIRVRGQTPLTVRGGAPQPDRHRRLAGRPPQPLAGTGRPAGRLDRQDEGRAREAPAQASLLGAGVPG